MSADDADRETDDSADAAEARDASYLKERVYATFTGLAIVLVLLNDTGNRDALHSLYALVIGVLGITTAGYLSDIIAHLAVHRAYPNGREHRQMLRVAGGALSTVVVPGALVGLAALGVFTLEAALRTASIVYLATLVVIAYLAVHRAGLRPLQRVLALGSLVALGAVVIGLQTIAHAG
ncbi:hypothetical protein G3T36_07555 [Diaminobutyricibacter tongyongensis]|uniref:VIT family protein n=1 Tax=Leifsonia tongyongensis TaxID=1268043 RepID=A0A6L9XWS0_9MICO|nr:hypothetical protein [Diaminobutyricibacter tongyongensis]NEN05726.1 hypothetical protein [Diaminobutyricibacter tongyongensis]